MEIYNPDKLVEEKERFSGKKILLHACCAVCASYVAELLKGAFKEVVLYFYNPNIHPPEEYYKRLEAMEKVAEIHNLKFIEGEYNPEKWYNAIRGLENEPEGGQRCEICFSLRLDETASQAAESNLDYFTSTLTVSPHKNSGIINQRGERAGKKYNIEFLAADFKKNDGFKKSIALSKKYNLYHQNYCGCVYSKNQN